MANPVAAERTKQAKEFGRLSGELRELAARAVKWGNQDFAAAATAAHREILNITPELNDVVPAADLGVHYDNPESS